MGNKNNTFTIKRDPKWDVLSEYHFTVDDFHHGNDGPWPQPAPDNPINQMAEVTHLPEQEKKDWKKYVGNMYRWRVLTQWPMGLWYACTHKQYKKFNDEEFNTELCEGLYSKFITDLDEGDLELFKDIKLDSSATYKKTDFSGMEAIAPHCYDGMYAAASITLIQYLADKPRGSQYEVIAIYLYPDADSKGTVFNAHDGESWHLAKYFVLQGAVHRVNLTEHALLHFPYDAINAITKSILPKDHLLYQLLIPHLLLSLGVNKAVLENDGSLINRGKHKFYSPFCAEGIHIRKLLPDGYKGRDDKPNGYPEYFFPKDPILPESHYGDFLGGYYKVFEKFTAKILDCIEDDDEKSWELIGLWTECIREWMPGFPTREDLIENSKPKDRPQLYKVVTMIMWDLSVAHATDHIAIHHKQAHGNPFRLRVAPPYNKAPKANWHENLVKRRDLLTFWFTDLLFYKPANVTCLQDVEYPFNVTNNRTQHYLEQANVEFRAQLKQCEQSLKQQGTVIAADLSDISTSLQY